MTEHEMKFIELLLKYDEELVYSLERRQQTSKFNKQNHQEVLSVLTYTYSESKGQNLLDALNQDEYYKYKQLSGVIMVMDVDNSVKVDIIAAYNIWLDTSK